MSGTGNESQRRRLAGLAIVVVSLHLVGLGVLARYAGPFPSLVGLGLAAYLLGLRHGVDPDHIAAIDDSVRFMLRPGRTPLATGFFFALGHSSVVFGMACAVALSTPLVERALPSLQVVGDVIGAGVSGIFLWTIALLNTVVLVDLLRARTIGAARGRIGRIAARRPGSFLSHSWQMFPLGALFAMSFDAASEVALLAMTAGAAVGGLPVPALLCIPVLFTAGMTLVDSIDGVAMCKVYRWAADDPDRKRSCDIAITAASIGLAIVVGTLQVAHLGADLGRLRSSASIAPYALAGFVAATFLAFAVHRTRLRLATAHARSEAG